VFELDLRRTMYRVVGAVPEQLDVEIIQALAVRV
jgi:hypothetical protein